MGSGGKGAGSATRGAGARTGAGAAELNTARERLLVGSDRLQDEVNNMRDVLRRVGLSTRGETVRMTDAQARQLNAGLDELEMAIARITDRAIVRGVSVSRPLGSRAIALENMARRLKAVDVLRPGGVNFYRPGDMGKLLRRSYALAESTRRVARVLGDEADRRR